MKKVLTSISVFAFVLALTLGFCSTNAAAIDVYHNYKIYNCQVTTAADNYTLILTPLNPEYVTLELIDNNRFLNLNGQLYLENYQGIFPFELGNVSHFILSPDRIRCKMAIPYPSQATIALLAQTGQTNILEELGIPLTKIYSQI